MNRCRHCGNQNLQNVVDLGFAPPSNAYLTKEQLTQAEITLPLHILVCDQCWLVQTQDFATPETYFSEDYAYFSSTSSSWLAHAKHYCEQVTERFNLDKDSFVIEIAANDGYLLKNFVTIGIPCLGIEPTKSTATAARALGINIIESFFTNSMANTLRTKGYLANLIVANNVFAHVPDINDFSLALATILAPQGVITLEFPHLLNLIKQVQFDTLYHEHFSYLSLFSVNRILSLAGLRIFDVETLTTHGGSLRVFACHQNADHQKQSSVEEVIEEEYKAELQQISGYRGFQAKVESIKYQLLEFLLEQKRFGKTVVAYGAAAKGNTLLNFTGVKADLLPVVYDAAVSKQDKYLPGSHIPIVAPSAMPEQGLDYVLILPWNIADEIKEQYSYLRQQGTQFVVAIPRLTII
ncbi:C-methyltransferase C-terminal domain [Shewanella putrefaciens]|nr:C-methyltransferase C-terminal domain [Shewanella putrefaciens]